MADNLALQILITAKDMASSAVNQVRQGINSLGGDSKAAGAGLDTLGNHASGLATKLTALAGTYLSLQGLKSAITSILNTGGNFERLSVQMQAVMGSIEGGERATQWVKDFAKNTPFEVEGVTQAFIKMKAMGLDPMDGSLQAVADQTAKLGGDQQTLEGIVLALGQAFTKQKLQAEEANQLIERGVPVWDLLSQKLGKTTAELIAMAEKGQLGRAEIKLLIDAIGESSKGASENLSKTWVGMVSNLSDTWHQFLDSIAQSGTLDYFKTQLQGLLDKTSEMANNGQLQSIAQQISGFFVSIGEGVNKAIGFVQGLMPAITGVVESAGPQLTALKDAAAALSQPFVDLINLLTGRGVEGPVEFGDAVSTVLTTLIELVTPFVDAFTTGINAISTGFYGLAGVGAEVVSGIASGIAKVQETIASLTFGDVSARWQAEADSSRRISEAFAESARVNFEKADQSLQKTAVSAEATRDSFGKLASDGDKAAKTVEVVADRAGITADELDKLGEGAEVAGGKVVNMGDHAEKAANGVNTVGDAANGTGKSLADAGDKAKEAESAFKALGVKSSADLQKLASDAEAAFNTIKNSGNASADDLAKAFQSYAQKVVEANKGVITEALKAEAAENKMMISLDNAGKAIVKSTSNQGAAYKSLESQVVKLNEAKIAETLTSANSVEMSKLSAQQAYAVGQAKLDEANALLSKADAAWREAMADGELSTAEKALILDAKQLAEAKYREAEAFINAAKAKAQDAQQSMASGEQTTAAMEDTAKAADKAQSAQNVFAMALVRLNGVLYGGLGQVTAYNRALGELQATMTQADAALNALGNGSNMTVGQLRGAAEEAKRLADYLSKSSADGIDTEGMATRLKEAMASAADTVSQKFSDFSAEANESAETLNDAFDKTFKTAESGIKDVTDASAEALKAVGDKLQQNLESINQGLFKTNLGIDDTIRGMERKSMNSVELYKDTLDDINQVKQDIQTALDANDIKTAEALSARMAKLAEEFNAVTDPATKKAILLAEDANKLTIEYLNGVKVINAEIAEQKRQQAIDEAAEKKKVIEQETTDKIAQINKIKAQELQAAKEVHDTRMAQLEAEYGLFVTMNGGVAVKAPVQTGKFKTGVGFAAQSTGGIAGKPTQEAWRLSRGGRLPGYGGGDKVPALLEDGEYVVRKEAVARLGEATLDLINRGLLPAAPIKRSTGGSVHTPATGEPAKTITLQFVPPNGGPAVAGQFAESDVHQLLQTLKSAGMRTL